MNVLVKLQHGSRLYGTSIPSSDQDYRGIYLPTRAECYLNQIKDTVNDPAEEDTQYFSLQYFMQLAAQGQSIAVEMLVAPDDLIVEVQALMDASDLPDRVDDKWCEAFVLEAYD